MKLRNTIILLVVLVALGAYAWYITQNPSAIATNASATPSPTPAVVFDFNTDNVVKFQVSDLKKNQTVSVTKQGDNWHMDQPKDSATDPLRVTTAIGDLAHLTASRVLTNTTDLGQFGLTSPALEARITLSDTTQYVLKVGDQTPDQSDYYAQKGDDKQVYLLPTFIQQSMTDFLSNPPYPPTPTLTPLPTLPPTATPAPGTGTPTASGSETPAPSPSPTP